MTTAQAYKWVVAWCHVFQKAGYACINHEGTLEHANAPTEETLELIQKICEEPIEKILQRTFFEKPADANQKQKTERIYHHDETSVQLNMRVKSREKAQFNALCSKLQLNQRECFSALLSLYEENESSQCFSLLNEYQKKCKKLESENTSLKKQNALLRGNAVPPMELLAKKQLEFIRKGIESYMGILLPTKEHGKSLLRYSYRKFMDLVKGRDYTYPHEEGFFCMTLEALLWGASRSPAVFLVGTDQFNNRIKLRYYPKWFHIGVRLLDNSLVTNGSRWYIGCQKAKDGAMEIVAMLPMDTTTPKGKTSLETQESHKVSLDTLIQKADAAKRVSK